MQITTAEKVIYGLGAIAVVVCIVVVVGFAPTEFGKIDQGRVIAYDKEKKIVTFIRDSKEDAKKPDYNTLPPHVYKMPPLERATGPEPEVGKRMRLIPEKNEIIIFDDATQSFKTISFKTIDKKEGIKRKDPLVEGKKFPIVDREKKTITVYSRRLEILETFTVPDEYFALPDNTWKAGDEIRIYSKKGNEWTLDKAGQAWKFMNITKTDIYKK